MTEKKRLEYTHTQDPDALREALPKGMIWANVRQAAVLVDENFALLPVYTPHQAGGNLFVSLFQVDHIPTGRRVFSGWGGGVSEREGRALSLALASIPFDWSTTDAERIESFMAGEEQKSYLRALAKATGVVPDDETMKVKTWDEFINGDEPSIIMPPEEET